MPASRARSSVERLSTLICRRGIDLNALQRHAHRGDVCHVSPEGLNARRDLALGRVVANKRADYCALLDEPLEDLRPDGAGAARDENGHRLAPCCKPKTMADDVGTGRGLETRPDGWRRHIYRPWLRWPEPPSAG